MVTSSDIPTFAAAMTAGRPWPLGVAFTGDGVNLAVFSAHAEAIELCLFDETGGRELARRRLPSLTDGVFHGHLAGIGPGQVYGLRAYGPFDPARGQRFNPNRLLLDPYARGLAGRHVWDGPNLVDPKDPFAFDPRDSAAYVIKGVMLPAPEAVPGPRLETPWSRSIIYEAHVRGLTRLHPDVPEAARGRFAGLSHPRVLDHLLKLGVTAVELLPVMAFIDELRLTRAGLGNYWGYNTHAFLALDPRYGIRDPQAEFAAMVATLHGAGLEVILDVVYNHTAEGDELGPTLSLRGLDNASYYRLKPEDQRLYVNDTGCGNTLNTAHPRTMQLVLDSLRHFAGLGVDGFRFDLAPVLGRVEAGAFDRDAPLLQAIRQDPVLGRLKLIAEPWDVGRDGYQLGQFPPPFSEWNDHFRDGVRRFWRGDEAVLPELGHLLMGSRGFFGANQGSGVRGVQASINLVTSHDGFTLFDTVAFAAKHNEANAEQNRDGAGENYSSNAGEEGVSDDPRINVARRRRIRNMLATLMLARGVPMLTMGDEALRSQGGNNNAYCQDNETSWYLWAQDEAAAELTAFVARLAELRQTHPLLDSSQRYEAAAIGWHRPDGRILSAEEWREPGRRMLVLSLRAQGRALFIVLNAGTAPAPLELAVREEEAGRLRLLLDTAEESSALALPAYCNGPLTVAAQCLQLYDVASLPATA